LNVRCRGIKLIKSVWGNTETVTLDGARSVFSVKTDMDSIGAGIKRIIQQSQNDIA